MATSAKRKNPEHLEPLENSELEVMRAKIRKLEQKNFELEAIVKANAELLNCKDAELQMIKNNQVDHYEHKENDVVDFLSAFMKNPGFKRIADNLLSFLDSKSFNRCRLVCRSWKDFIDNEWSMLQLQIFHVTWSENGRPDWPDWPPLKDCWLNFGPLFKIMEKITNKSELRIFIQMCREMVSGETGDCNRKLERDPLVYMIDHHRHQELTILLHPFKDAEIYTHIFKYACQYGCEICVKLLLDLSEEKEIDLNLIKKWDRSYKEPHEYEHCLIVAFKNICFKKDVLDLLLRSAEEKGIDMNAKTSRYGDNTLRDKIIFDLKYSWSGIGDYTEATYKILKIDPSVHLKKTQ